ncbi:MAG: lysylphosphatidylglycerol synthase transmembrane domain-containing protein [Bacillota bacterium]|nr:flippase-like domain-containing protein [Bacillota bacterium]HOB91013.1 lysylphosphatidylglycerol synthase transmembrane domain-containing protein [Bacillota bacterium]HPZ54139.1 lysylphosphatidylglycerol synthase transmembrane domain-containing protein [Bacillota bacterium]HQD18061.1 lysylphosphatidylglycerol synthase transmembrane domain-containing protein [Bacillota bacterium]
MKTVSKVSLKRGLLISIGISVVSILFILALSRNDFEIESLQRIKPEYLLLGLSVTVAAWCTKVLRLYLLSRALGNPIGYFRLFEIYMSAVFVSHVTPFTSGGLPLQVYLMHKEGQPIGRSSAVSIIDSALTTALLILLGPALLYIYIRKREYSLSSQVDRLIDIAIAIMIALAVLMVVLIVKSELLVGLLRRVSRLRVVKRFVSPEKVDSIAARLTCEIEQFKQDTAEMLRNARLAFFLAIVCTLLYWGFYLAIAPVTLLGLGIRPPIARTLLAQIVFNIIQPFIPTPGGSGGSEIGFALLFQPVVPKARLPLFVSTWRFFTYYTSLVIGGVMFYKAIGTRGKSFLGNGQQNGAQTEGEHGV